jgi:GNAT superfamily N-acetyltransferase
VVNIRSLTSLDAHALQGLSDVLMDCVAGGASVSFMATLTRERADAFWSEVIAGAERGKRMLLIAEDEAAGVIGTVQLVFSQAENQPHRADIAKMLVHRKARRRGIGAALLKTAETLARQSGRTLLVLDTASGEAERLYAALGWQRCGVIPGYALLPNGSLCDTTVFYRTL